ncbi:hypothetical protein ENHAE0001_2055, partial [Enhydrobacter aerosaccus SK60]
MLVIETLNDLNLSYLRLSHLQFLSIFLSPNKKPT